jgi:hypothetical protein
MESPFSGRATFGGRSPTHLQQPPRSLCFGDAYIGTNLPKDDPEIEEIREEGWANVLSFEQVKYVALDARLGFGIARKHFQFAGYNAHVDHLNVALIK